jgi:hypothetical protein
MEGADLGIGDGEVRDEVPWVAAELAGLHGGSRKNREAAPSEGFGRHERRRHCRRRGLEWVRRGDGVGRAEETGGVLADPHGEELEGSAGLPR